MEPEFLTPRLTIEEFHNTGGQSKGLERPSVDSGAEEDVKGPASDSFLVSGLYKKAIRKVLLVILVDL